MHTTEPHALQAILQTVNDPGSGDSIRQRWTKALGCKPGIDEFARRHSEVVSLLAESSRLIATLPQEKQANYAGSVNAWWQVAISPDKQWGTGGNKGKLIGVEHIQILGGLGDLIEARLDKTPASPGGFKIEEVRGECEAWLVGIQEFTLPDRFRELLVEGIEHLIWLIDNADQFGYARVARAAEAVTGQMATATVHVPEAQRPTWRERFNGFAGVLLAFSALTQGADLAIENTADLYKTIEPGVSQVIDMVSGEDDPPE